MTRTEARTLMRARITAFIAVAVIIACLPIIRERKRQLRSRLDAIEERAETTDTLFLACVAERDHARLRAVAMTAWIEDECFDGFDTRKQWEASLTSLNETLAEIEKE